jgi:RimJ/RimL family protein N-acetyltransferase
MRIPPKDVVLQNGLKLSLRSVRPAEAAVYLEHLKVAHHESYRNLNRDRSYWEGVKLEDEEALLLKIENSPLQFMLGAYLDDVRIVGGLGVFSMSDGFARFNGRIGLSIQMAYSGQGLGSELMEYALELARMAGLHRLDLTVRTFNEAGIRLYEKFGFQRVGLLKEVAFVDGQWFDEWMYERVLG